MLTGISVWNLAEVQIGIIAACGPTLRPILSHILPTQSIRSLLGSLRVSSGGNDSHKVSELPSFVKMDSTADLQVPGQVQSSENISRVEPYELTFRTESTQKH